MLPKNYARKIYKLRKNNRVPLWAELKEIKQFYLDCPEGMVVDHIIPLGSKYVSGLHVLDNLQYLEIEKNRKKGRNFEDIHLFWRKEYTKEFLKKNSHRYKAQRQAYGVEYRKKKDRSEYFQKYRLENKEKTSQYWQTVGKLKRQQKRAKSCQ